MTAWIAVAAMAAVVLAILGLGGAVWARLRGYGPAAEQDTDDPALTLASSERPGGFALERYRPLTRLLADEDVEFLRRVHNCPKIAARWKRQRVRIARLYLSDLAADFRRLHAEARALAAESPEQYSELVGVLMRQQVTFWRVMAEAELRLTLSWLGLEHMDASRLIEQIAAMHAEIARTVGPSAA
jgi:hypothetical protein